MFSFFCTFYIVNIFRFDKDLAS